MKLKLTPGALVVTVGSVEDPAFALFANPSPGLIFTQHEDGTAVFIMIALDVRLIPRFNALSTAPDWVVFLARSNTGGQHAVFVAMEATAHQLYKSIRVTKTGAGAMHGDERTAVFHDPQQGGFLSRCQN